MVYSFQWLNVIIIIFVHGRPRLPNTTETIPHQYSSFVLLICKYFLQDYGFTVSPFYELLLEVRDQYTEILMQEWYRIFAKIFEDDDYTAILVKEEEEYFYIIKKFPYIDEQLEKVSCYQKQFYIVFNFWCSRLDFFCVFL